MYDIIIIGGGVVGCSLLYSLSKYDLRVMLLEKEHDISCGCSKANSGIVHAGYDAPSGSMKARFNLLGSKMYEGICKELYVPYNNTGSLVLANEDKLNDLHKLFERGKRNGVEGLEIIDRKRVLEFEPNVSDEVSYALYAPTASIVSPYELTWSLAEYGVINGAEVKLNSEVVNVKNLETHFSVSTVDAEFCGHVVINCCGFGADKINRLAGEDELRLSFKKGEYFILDSVERDRHKITCFPLPDDRGKGVIVSPTACGNVIIGPTSVDIDEGTDTSVTYEGLNLIRERASSMIKGINFKNAIRVFAGVRVSCGDDFVIKNGKNPNFITVAGICSPGLTAAPAIAEYVCQLLKNTSLKVIRKPQNALVPFPKPVRTRELNETEWTALIAKNPLYGVLVCRCEKITEGEIIDALNSRITPTSLDGVKRRVRSGMGRCQGTFCSPRIIAMLSEKLNIPIEKINQNSSGSEVVPFLCKEGI